MGLGRHDLACPVAWRFRFESSVAPQAWGQGLLVMPHGLAVEAGGGVWVTDLVRHQARSIFKRLAQSPQFNSADVDSSTWVGIKYVGEPTPSGSGGRAHNQTMDDN